VSIFLLRLFSASILLSGVIAATRAGGSNFEFDAPWPGTVVVRTPSSDIWSTLGFPSSSELIVLDCEVNVP
jgi:hypothetical protein